MRLTQISVVGLRKCAAFVFFCTGVAACSSGRPAVADLKLVEAQRLFQAHCANAGEKIIRTANNVDGILLLKVRQVDNFGDQFAQTDPYGDALTGRGYIKSFLRETHDTYLLRRQAFPAVDSPYKPSPVIGYGFVEAIDSTDGGRYRYTAHIEQPSPSKPGDAKVSWEVVLDRSIASGTKPRYGVIYDDISTYEDRTHWIAGSSLRVIDLEKNEIIAERIGYMMDPGQGNRSGGRSPWLIAAQFACPPFPGPHASTAQIGQTDRFVEKVLRPTPRSQSQ